MEIATIILLLLIVGNFVVLTKGWLETSVGMTLVMLLSLLLVGPTEAHHALREGFAGFASIFVLFTAIAVPSHQLARSDLLNKAGTNLGEWIGNKARGRNLLERITKSNIDQIHLVVASSMLMTFFFAGVLHNTTSILISAAIITVLCKSYKIPTIPVLSGALVASNLGGFSTRWGDTPNIVEAQVWGLTHADFFGQIMWVNLGLIFFLIILINWLVRRTIKKEGSKVPSEFELTYSMIEFRTVKNNIKIDQRLALIGFVGLMIAVVIPLFFPAYELLLAGSAIVFCILMDYPKHRNHALFTLGINTYANLFSIFVIAQVMAYSSIGIGSQLEHLLEASNASVPLIIIISYFGTLLTEAASWATAAAPIVHSVDQSTKSAWALGAGICAGSSSLITAATAGIILLSETKDNELKDRMTFGKYVPVGIGFSAFMVLYYVIVLSLFL